MNTTIILLVGLFLVGLFTFLISSNALRGIVRNLLFMERKEEQDDDWRLKRKRKT